MLRVRRPNEPEKPSLWLLEREEEGADVGLVASRVRCELVSVAARELGAQDGVRRAQARRSVQIGEERGVEGLVAQAVEDLRSVVVADVGAAEGLEIERRRTALRAHLAPRRDRLRAGREQRSEALLHPRRPLPVRKAAQVVLVGRRRVRELALALARQAQELERLRRPVALGLLEDLLKEERGALELPARQRAPAFAHELRGPLVRRRQGGLRGARLGARPRVGLHAHHDAAQVAPLQHFEAHRVREAQLEHREVAGLGFVAHGLERYRRVARNVQALARRRRRGQREQRDLHVHRLATLGGRVASHLDGYVEADGHVPCLPGAIDPHVLEQAHLEGLRPPGGRCDQREEQRLRGRAAARGSSAFTPSPRR